jgi:hypothetical protein
MTDEAIAIAEAPRFSIGRVLGDSFETLAHRFPRFVAIAAIAGTPLLVWLVLGGAPVLAKFASTARLLDSRGHFDAVMAILLVFIWLIALAIDAAASDAAFQHLLGEEDDLGRNLSRAVTAAPSLIAANLFVMIGFMLGAMVLALAIFLLLRIHWALAVIVGLPGAIGALVVLVRWSLLIPVIVIERADPIACFKRSSGLTHGHRWKLLALLLIVYLPQSLINYLLAHLALALGPALVGMLDILLSGVFVTFNAVVGVMAYGHLSAIKEGTGTAALAGVFD